MQDLIKQEQFEIEVLDSLNSGRLLAPLVLGGGTMLRLCYGLNRFSVDLDFWFIKKVDYRDFFAKCRNHLKGNYQIKDAANKFYTILFEINKKGYTRALKIEIRKGAKKIKYEESIAFSKHSSTQVLLKTISLEDMMQSKISAFLDRGEIRDCFDMEFLLKRGIDIKGPDVILRKLLKQIDSLTKKDYTAKLGSILETKDRRYYISNNFKLLESTIRDRLSK